MRAFGSLGAAAVWLSLGILLQRSLAGAERTIPMEIYGATSYSAAFLQGLPLPLAMGVGLFLVAFAAWIAIRPQDTGWQVLGAPSGLRWLAFGIAMAFCWSYAGHGFNYYFGQAHRVDRALLLLSTLVLLRSPLWLPVFLAQMLLSRAQVYHPAALATPIADELPFRVLCILTVFVACRFLLRGIEASKPLRALRWRVSSRLGIDSLVLALLCMVGYRPPDTVRAGLWEQVRNT